MSLKSFHILFVSVSSLLAFLLGGWNLYGWSGEGGAGALVMGIGSLLAGVGLIVYGFWFWKKITTGDEERRRRRKKLHTVTAILAVWAFSTRVLPACSVCYGDAEGPMIDAARMGVWLLFGMTFAVQAAFGLFFINLWRRARRHRQEEGARTR